MMKRVPGLSKSKYIAGLQCLKMLYLAVFSLEKAAEAGPGLQARFDQGEEVNKYARQIYPGGVLVEQDIQKIPVSLAQTKKLVGDASVRAIFAGTFTHDNILIKADIMERLADGMWNLIEVKSSTEVKDHHLPDVAIQKYVLEGYGLNLAGVFLMHINNNYVYEGGEYDLDKLFTRVDVAERIRPFEGEIQERLKAQREALCSESAPQVETGKHCSEPYKCDFWDVCHEEVPENHVSRLPRVSVQKLADLAERGIELIEDIADDFSLTDQQSLARKAIKAARTVFAEGLKDTLKKLMYPLYFMDFETINPALPWFPGLRPCEKLPFQWSVDVQDEPRELVVHYEFLSDNNEDPRDDFIYDLLDILEGYSARDAQGHIVVYNANFEKGILKELAAYLPQYRERIEKVIGRLWDLLPVVRYGVYNPAFSGSYSLKAVLPALVPGMSYAGMTVSEGDEAGLAYTALMSGELESDEWKTLRAALLDYCHQDTLGMVKILDFMWKTA